MAQAGLGREPRRIDGLDLVPDRRLGGRDDALLLLLEHVRDLLRQGRGLSVQPGQLVAGGADLRGEVGLRLLLLRLQILQLGQVRGLLLAQLLRGVAGCSHLGAVVVQLGEVDAELVLERLGPGAGGAQVVDPRDHLAQALGFDHQQQHRAGLRVDGPGQGADLGFLARDASIGVDDLGVQLDDLSVEVGELGLGVGDAGVEHLLLARVVAQRLRDLVLGLEGGRQLRAQLGPNGLDDLGPRLGGGDVGGGGRRSRGRAGSRDRQRRQQGGQQEPEPHDSRCLRTLPKEETEPSNGPARKRKRPITRRPSGSARARSGRSWRPPPGRRRRRRPGPVRRRGPLRQRR